MSAHNILSVEPGRSDDSVKKYLKKYKEEEGKELSEVKPLQSRGAVIFLEDPDGESRMPDFTSYEKVISSSDEQFSIIKDLFELWLNCKIVMVAK